MINLSTQRKGSFGIEIKQLKLQIKPCFQCLEAAYYDLRLGFKFIHKIEFSLYLLSRIVLHHFDYMIFQSWEAKNNVKLDHLNIFRGSVYLHR